MSFIRSKSAAALLIMVMLCILLSACGAANKNSEHSQTSAQAAASSSTETSQEHIQENVPLDADHDTDGADPDEDDPAKPPPLDNDNDTDGTTKARFDSDDANILDFGHPAGATERKQITALIKRYYVVAAAENGAKACMMIYSTIAEAMPADAGTSPPGPEYAKGTTCPTIMTKIFKHDHALIAGRLPDLKISQIRVKERQAIAILSSPKSEREMTVKREGNTWKMSSVIDTELP